MMKGATRHGFAFEVSKKVLDDMELLDAIAEIDTNPLALSKVLVKVIGPEQKKALYDHLRGEDGRVSVRAVSEAISDIFTSSGQGKN